MSRFVMIWQSCALTCLLAFAPARSEPPATGPATAIPSAAQQTHAREVLHKLFAKEYVRTAPADKQALAKLLLAQAKETNDDMAVKYAALADAADLAAAGGDAVTAFAAIEELSHHFAIDALDMRRRALVTSELIADDAPSSEIITRLAFDTADQAATVDAFDTVDALASVAERAANKTHQVKIVASIQVRLANLRELAAEFPKVKAAFAQLSVNARDADAHLVLGRFYALHKGQWNIGLPHLAASGDETLRSLAVQELAKPIDGLAQAALGDAWWDYAEKSTGLTHATVGSHATDWYKLAQQTIQGVTLARIQSRITATAGPQAATKSASTISPAVTIDLLSLIDVDKDAAQGHWSRAGDSISCDSSSYACLQLPCVPPEEYDLTASFTRQEGAGPIALLLVEGKRAFGFALDVKSEARFESVDKKAAKDNPTVVPVAISNGHRYTLTVEVRKDHVRALLDGKLLVEYKTDYKDLSRYAPWKLGDNSLCGIGANNAKVAFDKIELVEISGKGKRTR